MAAVATRGAVCFPRRVAELLRAGLDLRDRHTAGEVSRHGLAVARGRLESQLSELVFPPKTNAANERLAQHLWNHRDDLFTFLRQPGMDATNGRAELANRFGVILRKVWGGNRTWAGAGAVGPDVGVADLLATGAFGLGLPEPTPSRHAGCAGFTPLTQGAKLAVLISGPCYTAGASQAINQFGDTGQTDRRFIRLIVGLIPLP